MHGSRKICKRGSNSDMFFFQMMRERGSIQIPLKVGHLNGVSLVGR